MNARITSLACVCDHEEKTTTIFLEDLNILIFSGFLLTIIYICSFLVKKIFHKSIQLQNKIRPLAVPSSKRRISRNHVFRLSKFVALDPSFPKLLIEKIKQLHKQQSAKRMNQAGYAREKTEFQIRTIN